VTSIKQKFGAWYLDPKTWQRRAADEPLKDPNDHTDEDMSDIRKKSLKLVSNPVYNYVFNIAHWVKKGVSFKLKLYTYANMAWLQAALPVGYVGEGLESGAFALLLLEPLASVASAQVFATSLLPANGGHFSSWFSSASRLAI